MAKQVAEPPDGMNEDLIGDIAGLHFFRWIPEWRQTPPGLDRAFSFIVTYQPCLFAIAGTADVGVQPKRSERP